MKNIIGVRFKKLGKIYFFNPKGLRVKKGDKVIVETTQGEEYGEVMIPNRFVNDEKIIAPLKKVIRLANNKDDKHYEECRKKEKEARKKQKTFELKEIRVTPNIEEHDFGFKSKNARKFIEDGSKVKITVRFRGREINNSKLGESVLNKFIEELEDVAQVEKKPLLEGRNMFIILSKKA